MGNYYAYNQGWDQPLKISFFFANHSNFTFEKPDIFPYIRGRVLFFFKATMISSSLISMSAALSRNISYMDWGDSFS